MSTLASFLYTTWEPYHSTRGFPDTHTNATTPWSSEKLSLLSNNWVVVEVKSGMSSVVPRLWDFGHNIEAWLQQHFTAATSYDFVIVKVALLVITFIIFARTIYRLFLYPLFLSPLVGLPYAKRFNGWRGFFTMWDGDDILEIVNTVPNDGFIRYLDMFNRETILLTKLDGIAEFLGKADKFDKIPIIKRIMHNTLGPGIVSASGAEHKYQRKHFTPAFNLKIMKNIYPVFWSKGVEMVSLMRRDIETASLNHNSSDAKNKTLDIEDYASRCALDIIGSAGFGYDFNSLAEPDGIIAKAYRSCFAARKGLKVIYLLSFFISPDVVKYWPSKTVKEIREGRLRMMTFFRDLLTKRQERINSGEYEMELEKELVEGGHEDIVSIAMKGGAFSIDELVDQCRTFLGAGHQSSETAVTWGIYLLAQSRYRHIQQRLREEIRANLPSPDSGTPVTTEMWESLPYLDAVSKEILRFYAPVPSISRIPDVDVTLSGMKIPKGTLVRVYPWAINRAEHLWGPDAGVFNPERWLVGDKKATGGAESIAFMTFSSGPRMCMGKRFAMMEHKALLANLIGSLEFHHVGGVTPEPNVQFSITARITGGLNVKTTFIGGW